MAFKSFCRAATKRYIWEKIEHFVSFLHSLISIKWSQVRDLSLCIISRVYQSILISGKTNFLLKTWLFLILKRKEWKLIFTMSQKLKNFDYCLKTGLFFFKLVWAFKSHPETSEALIIKWTTSGEPPVGSRSHQNSKWGHSWVILLVTNWLPPCIFENIRIPIWYKDPKLGYWVPGLLNGQLTMTQTHSVSNNTLS